MIVNKDVIKRGHYVRVYGSVKGNGSTSQPGVYLNFSMVEHVCFGDEIKTGPDGAAVFGGAPVTDLPAGGTTTPTTSAPPIAPPPGAGVAPAHDFVTPPPPPAAAVKYQTGGKEYTRDELIAAGWQPAQIDALPTV